MRKIIMGAGSRNMVQSPDRLLIYKNLEQEVLRLAKSFDLHLISGGAEGWDEAIAKVALRNELPYTLMLPHKGYPEHYWGKNSLLKRNRMAEFNELLEGAHKVLYVCKDVSVKVNGGNQRHSNFVRNDLMISSADAALVYDGGTPGTNHAIEQLDKAKKPYKVAPFSLEPFTL
jgi:predicted Rossmann-fold nucleotide-binding protein